MTEALLVAHIVTCTASQTRTTGGLAFLAGVLVLRPWRVVRGWRPSLATAAVPVLFAAVVAGTACGGGSHTAAKRPTTQARLEILSPAPNQVTGPDLKVRLRLDGARVITETKRQLRADEGHVHVTLDGKLVSMAYGLEQDLAGLAPGPHSVQAEFVAADHAPFKNRVVAAVLFRVGP